VLILSRLSFFAIENTSSGQHPNSGQLKPSKKSQEAGEKNKE